MKEDRFWATCKKIEDAEGGGVKFHFAERYHTDGAEGSIISLRYGVNLGEEVGVFFTEKDLKKKGKTRAFLAKYLYSKVCQN